MPPIEPVSGLSGAQPYGAVYNGTDLDPLICRVSNPLPPLERGLSVKYVGGDDVMSRLERFFSFTNTRSANSVTGMVNAIIDKAKGEKIRRLEITGHGCPGYQWIGDYHARISYRNLDGHRSELQRLKPHLTQNAVVTLGGCSVGEGAKGRALIEGMARILGVEVRATDAKQIAWIPGHEGNTIRCRIDANGRAVFGGLA